MSKTNNNYKVYVNADGERVMRITEVIKILAKDQLMVWANMLGFKRIDYKQELERTANIGSMIHGMIEDFNNPNVLAIIDYEKYGIYSYGDMLEAKHAMMSFNKWYAKNKDIYKVVFTERVVVGKEVGGTIDTAIQGIKDPRKIILIDYKNSAAVQFSMILQLAGYVQLYEEVYGPDTVEGICILRFDKKHGDMAEECFIPREKLEPYISCFGCLLTTAKYTKLLERQFREDSTRLR